jgi:hypothetical protein
MAVLRSYKCPRHGYFDAWEPLCEHGCTDVAVVFLKAPSMRDSIKAGRSKRNDNNLKQLAADFGMSDIKSVKEGESQQGYITRNNAKIGEQEAEMARQAKLNGVMWGDAGKYSMQGMLAGGAVKSAMGEPVGFNPKDANLPTKLPTVVHATDPTLKIGDE